MGRWGRWGQACNMTWESCEQTSFTNTDHPPWFSRASSFKDMCETICLWSFYKWVLSKNGGKCNRISHGRGFDMVFSVKTCPHVNSQTLVLHIQDEFKDIFFFSCTFPISFLGILAQIPGCLVHVQCLEDAVSWHSRSCTALDDVFRLMS